MEPTRDDVLDRVRIPTLRESTQRVLELVDDPAANAVDYARLVITDPGLSSSVLRLVNSALYSLRRDVVDVKDACVLLGLRNLSSLCLSAALGEEFRTETSPVVRACWKYTMATGRVARSLAQDCCPESEAEVSTAGLLHVVGMIALLTTDDLGFAPSDYETPPTRDWSTVQREAFGFDHAQLAEGIAGRWRMAPTIAHLLGAWDDVAAITDEASWCIATASNLVQARIPGFVHRADLDVDLGVLQRALPACWNRVEDKVDDAIGKATLTAQLVAAR